MSKPKYYFANFKKDGKLSRGVLVQAKCERSALFYISNNYNLEEWKLNRLVEINYKVYSRLIRLNDLRIKKKHEDWVKSGGERRAKEALIGIAALNAAIGGPYGGYL